MLSSSSAFEVFKKIQKDPANQKCADCNSPEAIFASLSHGSFICKLCADEHKSLGSQISYVKALGDVWTSRQLKFMTSGGNPRLKKFFETFKIPKHASVEFKYSTLCARYYREMLISLAEEQPCHFPTPEIHEGIMLITNPLDYGNNDFEEEDKKNVGFGTIMGNAFKETIGVGKGIYSKVKENGAYKIIGDKASTAVKTVEKGIKWGAEKGKEHIEKGIELGKEGIEWSRDKAFDQLGKEANKGVDLIKSGASQALEITKNVAVGYKKFQILDKAKSLKDDTMEIINTIEKKTIGKLRKQSTDNEYSFNEDDVPSTPPNF